MPTLPIVNVDARVLLQDATGAAVGTAANPLVATVGAASGTVSTANSSTATLLANAAFTGTSEDVTGYSAIVVSAFSDQASAANGLSAQFSSNGTNWDITKTQSVGASVGAAFVFKPSAKFFRLVYTNGTVNQGAFRLQTVYHQGALQAAGSVSGTSRGIPALNSLLTGLDATGVINNNTASDDPTLIPFTWTNQGSATAVSGTQSVYFSDITLVAADNLRLRLITAPATPYTITMGCIPNMTNSVFLGGGLAWTDGTKVVTYGIRANTPGDQILLATKWTNVTTFSADYAMVGGNTFGADAWKAGGALWLRIGDDGTNRTGWVSADGANFTKIFTIGRTDFLTPTQVGLYLDPNNANLGAAINVFSWVQA